MITLSRAIIFLTAISLCGCGTTITKSRGAWGQSYSGTKCSWSLTDMAAHDFKVLTPFFAIDLALSAVVDTVVLPVDWTVKKFSKTPDNNNHCNFLH